MLTMGLSGMSGLWIFVNPYRYGGCMHACIYIYICMHQLKHLGYFNHISVISVACVWCTHREVQGMLPNKSSEDLEIKRLLI